MTSNRAVRYWLAIVAQVVLRTNHIAVAFWDIHEAGVLNTHKIICVSAEHQEYCLVGVVGVADDIGSNTVLYIATANLALWDANPSVVKLDSDYVIVADIREDI